MSDSWGLTKELCLSDSDIGKKVYEIEEERTYVVKTLVIAKNDDDAFNKYLDEALEFATESDIKIDEAEIIRCNSSGLMIYNPKNASDMLKAMKNKSVSRQAKIIAREEYEKAQSGVVN